MFKVNGVKLGPALAFKLVRVVRVALVEFGAALDDGKITKEELEDIASAVAAEMGEVVLEHLSGQIFA